MYHQSDCLTIYAASKGSKLWLVLYLILLLVSLALSTTSTAQGFLDKKNVYFYARRQWTEMSLSEEIAYQWDHLCCNFNIGPPCCRFAPGTGECINELKCYDTVDQHLIEQFELIAITSMIQAIYLFIVFLMAALFCKLIDRYPKLFKDGSGSEDQDEFENGMNEKKDTILTNNSKDEDYFKVT